MKTTYKALFIGGSQDGKFIDVGQKDYLLNINGDQYRRQAFDDESGYIHVFVLEEISEPLRHVLMKYAEMKGQK